MGEEIDTIHFTDQDFEHYHQCLSEETRLLSELFLSSRLSSCHNRGGFELEVWIVDENFNPIPINDAYLQELNSEWVSPELSLFNVELNGKPEELKGKALSRLQVSLEQSWQHCYKVAGKFNASLIMIGTLPSVNEDQLVLENMSRMKRYYALNEQVFRQRKGKPLNLDIIGQEHLKITHYDVMLESATTSFQLHWQMPLEKSVRAYNASQIAAAATVAVSANSPYLFGKDLWDETRIPLFEQSVQVGGFEAAAFGPTRRAGFGSGYVRESVMELFQENIGHYPVLLPIQYQDAKIEMKHLRLHNGTIWRWNRPLIGHDEDDTPHLRIEHRVISAGPTVIDSIANAAFYYGLANYLANLTDAPELDLPFATARDNFYACAKSGLKGHVTWLGGNKGRMKQLLQQELLAAAERGLYQMELSGDDISLYMGILNERVDKGQHGASWQRQYVKKHHCDMQTLTAAYAEHQQTGEPVHLWSL
ncbi:MAG TPA: glutamate--cysteine ligase [Gammaproteobacteria bacterium]|nr:glutamate--cysteine ligase [Gammaproteobacteria bacterium]